MKRNFQKELQVFLMFRLHLQLEVLVSVSLA
jgi:hypothetical protein